MDFAAIEKIINDIVGFITSFAANLKRFVGGFKGDLEFIEPTDAE